MVKIDWKTCFRVGISAFLLFLCIHYFDNLTGLLSLMLSAAVPLFIGAIVAYILNILMSAYERRYFPRTQKKWLKKSRRPVCMVAAILTLIVILAVVIGMIIPELIDCVKILAGEVVALVKQLLANPVVMQMMPDSLESALKGLDAEKTISNIANFLTSGITDTIGTITNLVGAIVSSTITWVVGIVFALYLLASKERLQNQICRIMDSYLPKAWNKKIRHYCEIFNDCFHNYIVGQCTEAMILGTLCMIGMLILRLPYAAMIGALVAVTALIPIAGAYIGAAVGAFMIFTVSPIQALIFLIFIVLLQQFEGNVIYPKVVGSSIGLPGLWVLAAVTVGGGVSGVLGMLAGVPIAASIYRLVREDVQRHERMPNEESRTGARIAKTLAEFSSAFSEDDSTAKIVSVAEGSAETEPTPSLVSTKPKRVDIGTKNPKKKKKR